MSIETPNNLFTYDQLMGWRGALQDRDVPMLYGLVVEAVQKAMEICVKPGGGLGVLGPENAQGYTQLAVYINAATVALDVAVSRTDPQFLSPRIVKELVKDERGSHLEWHADDIVQRVSFLKSVTETLVREQPDFYDGLKDTAYRLEELERYSLFNESVRQGLNDVGAVAEDEDGEDVSFEYVAQQVFDSLTRWASGPEDLYDGPI